jgi:hypothetical protein
LEKKFRFAFSTSLHYIKSTTVNLNRQFSKHEMSFFMFNMSCLYRYIEISCSILCHSLNDTHYKMCYFIPKFDLTEHSTQNKRHFIARIGHFTFAILFNVLSLNMIDIVSFTRRLINEAFFTITDHSNSIFFL